MRPFIDDLLERFKNHTESQDDRDWILNKLSTSIRVKRTKYHKHAERIKQDRLSNPKPRTRKIKVPDLLIQTEGSLYIKAKGNLRIYITKGLTVFEADTVVLCVILNDRYYAAKAVERNDKGNDIRVLTETQEKQMNQFIGDNPCRKGDLGKLQQYSYKVELTRFEQIYSKTYRNNSEVKDFWNLNVF